MKDAIVDVIVSKKDLIGVLTRVVPVSERKSTMPVLANVLLDARDGRLHVAATDLYMSMRGSAPAETKAAGKVAALGKDLVDRIKAMPEGPVHLSASGESLVVRAAGVQRRYTLRTMPGDDFPPIIDPGDIPHVRLPATALSGLIARAEHAISPDQTRAHLNAMLLEMGGGIIRAVATDGHRLTKVEAKVADAPDATLLIPQLAIKPLARMCEAPAETIELAWAKGTTTAHFIADGYVFSTRLVDATFPPYLQVIPTDHARRVRCDRALLADALKAVAMAAPPRTSCIKLRVDKHQVRVTAESGEKGEGFDEVPAELTGAPIDIGVSWKLLSDTLEAHGGDEVAIELGCELDPIVMRQPDFVGVVMPMRI